MQDSTRKSIFIVLVVVLAALIVAWWYSGFSLDFMKFFAAEPSPSAEVTPPPTPVGPVACAPSSQTVKAGEQATLSATGGSGAYTWYAPEGSPATGTGASFAVSYVAAGTKEITVEGPRGDAEGTVDSIACQVIVTP